MPQWSGPRRDLPLIGQICGSLNGDRVGDVEKTPSSNIIGAGMRIIFPAPISSSIIFCTHFFILNIFTIIYVKNFMKIASRLVFVMLVICLGFDLFMMLL